MKTYEIQCNSCGETWWSEFNDLAEYCPVCFRDDNKVIGEGERDPHTCPGCEADLILGHSGNCDY